MIISIARLMLLSTFMLSGCVLPPGSNPNYIANNNPQSGYYGNQTYQGHSDTVYSPGQGVVCDRKANFCADDQGMAVGFTKEYLGEQAERQLMEQIHGVGGVDNWDGSSYSLSNGVSCDSKARRCTGGRDAGTYSRILFGN